MTHRDERYTLIAIGIAAGLTAGLLIGLILGANLP